MFVLREMLDDEQIGWFVGLYLAEVVGIERAKKASYWDVSVEDKPHLFALASGVLTHNCMPSSAADRPTTDFEYIFLLAKNGVKPTFWTHRDGYGSRTKPDADYRWFDKKLGAEWDSEPDLDWKAETFTNPEQEQERRWKRYNLWKGHAYYYDSEAVKDPYTEPLNRWGGDSIKHETPKHSKYLEMQNVGISSAMRAGRAMRPDAGGRNKRCVWDIPTVAFSGTHFATFPPTLIEPMILAGSSDKACPNCGAAWFPMTKKKPSNGAHPQRGTDHRDDRAGTAGVMGFSDTRIVGFQPTCSCEGNDGSNASLVLDLFMGSGTTCMVAKQKHRHWLGIDASEEYVEMAERRVGDAEPESDLDADQLKMDFGGER
jgi:DNA modification methylase